MLLLDRNFNARRAGCSVLSLTLQDPADFAETLLAIATLLLFASLPDFLVVLNAVSLDVTLSSPGSNLSQKSSGTINASDVAFLNSQCGSRSFFFYTSS